MSNKYNTGNWNTGNRNTGDCNTGNRNTGDWNTGHWNTGNRNTGSWNSCDRNTGNNNTGGFNTGNNNTGSRNTGNRNTGRSNTGSWNSCDYETGFFNTETSKQVRVFNKLVDRVLWDKAVKPDFLYFQLTEWINLKDMTEQEKLDNPSYKTCEGYLKVHDYKEAFQNAYNKASGEDKILITTLPGFDAEIFFEISGIDVRKPALKDEIVIDGVTYIKK